MKRLITIVISFFSCIFISDAGNYDLDGLWQFRFDEGTRLEDVLDPSFTANDVMAVPCCFDVVSPYLKSRGTAQYRKAIYIDTPVLNAVWCIDGIGLRGSFYLDGKYVGMCNKPYSYFELPLGPLAAGEHVLYAAIDNNFDSEKQKLFLPYYDFYAFGGFYRGMELKFQTKKIQLDKILVRTKDYKTGLVELEICTLNSETPASLYSSVQFDGGKWIPVNFVNGKVVINVPNFKLWSPESPNLHSVRVRYQGSVVQTRFGIRTVSVKGHDILLNGEKIFLKGVNRHEQHPSFGAATPEQLMQLDINLIKSLGANFVRGAHYPQSQKFLDLCDENGILVWEESLGWGNKLDNIQDPEFVSLQISQTKDMVLRSMNHPSVIIFAFLNEVKSNCPEGKAIIDTLIKTVKAQNPGRLTTFACNRTKNDIANVNTDLISFNTYPGWFETIDISTSGLLKDVINQKLDTIIKYFRSRYGDKPILISEIGMCGIYGFRDSSAPQWTEEFQAEYVGDALDYALTSDEICGIALWHFADADSFHRSGGNIRGKPFAVNLAGLVDSYRHPKLVYKVVESKFKNTKYEKMVQ